jgi:hypothetical protein
VRRFDAGELAAAAEALSTTVRRLLNQPQPGTLALLRLRPPAPEGYSSAQMEPPAARWEPGLGELLLDCDDVCNADDPHQTAMTPARSVVRHSCTACDWNPALAATVDGVPPPVR